MVAYSRLPSWGTSRFSCDSACELVHRLHAAWGSCLIPLTYLYVIGRYNLLELDLRVRRNFQYLVAAAIWRLGSFSLYVFLLLQLASWSVELPGVRFTGLSLEIMDQPVQEAEQLVTGQDRCHRSCAGIDACLLVGREEGA